MSPQMLTMLAVLLVGNAHGAMLAKQLAARSLAASSLPDPHCKTGVISMKISGQPQSCCAGYCGACNDYKACKNVNGQNSENACCASKVYEMRCGNAPANVCLKTCSEAVPPCIMDIDLGSMETPKVKNIKGVPGCGEVVPFARAVHENAMAKGKLLLDVHKASATFDEALQYAHDAQAKQQTDLEDAIIPDEYKAKLTTEAKHTQEVIDFAEKHKSELAALNDQISAVPSNTEMPVNIELKVKLVTRKLQRDDKDAAQSFDASRGLHNEAYMTVARDARKEAEAAAEEQRKKEEALFKAAMEAKKKAEAAARAKAKAAAEAAAKAAAEKAKKAAEAAKKAAEKAAAAKKAAEALSAKAVSAAAIGVNGHHNKVLAKSADDLISVNGDGSFSVARDTADQTRWAFNKGWWKAAGLTDWSQKFSIEMTSKQESCVRGTSSWPPGHTNEWDLTFDGNGEKPMYQERCLIRIRNSDVGYGGGWKVSQHPPGEIMYLHYPKHCLKGTKFVLTFETTTAGQTTRDGRIDVKDLDGSLIGSETFKWGKCLQFNGNLPIAWSTRESQVVWSPFEIKLGRQGGEARGGAWKLTPSKVPDEAAGEKACQSLGAGWNLSSVKQNCKTVPDNNGHCPLVDSHPLRTGFPEKPAALYVKAGPEWEAQLASPKSRHSAYMWPTSNKVDTSKIWGNGGTGGTEYGLCYKGS